MNEYVCAECGHEQNSMYRPCDNCESVRVVSIKFLEQNVGKNWRDCFRDPDKENYEGNVTDELA